MRAETLAGAQRAVREGATLRVVARARLRVPTPEAEGPTRHLLEDALNTAEFGDWGRLIVVRSLALPRIPAGASSHWIARAIEAAWRSEAVHAVHVSDPKAAAAPAVYFGGAEEARIELIQRLVEAHERVSAEWFWPSAVPEFLPGASRTDNCVRLLAALFASAPGLAALGGRLQTWSNAQVVDLVRCLPPASPEPLRFLVQREAAAAATEQSIAPRAAVEPVEHFAPVPLSAAHRRVVQRLAELAAALAAPIAPDDWRMVVVAAALLRWTSAEAPARGLLNAVLDAAMNEVSVEPRPSRRGAALEEVASQRQLGGAFGAVAQTQSNEVGRPAVETAGSPAIVSTVAAETAVERSRAPERAEVIDLEPLHWAPWLADAAPSHFGGLLLLLNVLGRLGIERWLALAPAALRRPFVIELLAHIARRLGIDAGDPHWRLLESEVAASEAARAGTWQWEGFVWPAWVGMDPPASHQRYSESLLLWARALRRALRLRYGIGVASVARRSAWVSFTPTHVDLVFALNAVDLRLRRCGLDQDPGWLPWFGRIVMLHFVGSVPRGTADA